jgi:hypothetical protein
MRVLAEKHVRPQVGGAAFVMWRAIAHQQVISTLAMRTKLAIESFLTLPHRSLARNTAPQFISTTSHCCPSKIFLHDTQRRVEPSTSAISADMMLKRHLRQHQLTNLFGIWNASAVSQSSTRPSTSQSLGAFTSASATKRIYNSKEKQVVREL